MTINEAMVEGKGYASLKKAVTYNSNGPNGNTNVIQGSKDRPRQPKRGLRIDEPCPPCPCRCSWTKVITGNLVDLFGLWKRFCRDPFRWQILKSSLWFTLAVTLFREMRGKSDNPTNVIEIWKV